MTELMCVDWTDEFPIMDDEYRIKWTKSDNPPEAAGKAPGAAPGEAARGANIQFYRKRLTIKPYKEAWVDPYKMVEGSWYQVVVKWLFGPLGGLPGPSMFDGEGSWLEHWGDYKNRDPAWFYARALEDLKTWNDGQNGTRNLFAEERFKPPGSKPLEPSGENSLWKKLTGGTVVKVPLLYGASYIPPWFQDLYGNKDPDMVLIRIPWMPEYDESKGADIDE
jgi:hypothetical protein